MLVRPWVFLLSATALAGGTAVGHPVSVRFASGDGLAFASGALPIGDAIFDHCDGTYETVEVDDALDPVANDALTFPPGDLCGVRLVLTGPVLLAGSGTGGGTFSLSLGVGQIDVPVDPPVYVPSDGSSGGTWVRLAAMDWVTADLLDLDANETITIGASSPLHDDLVDAIQADSRAW